MAKYTRRLFLFIALSALAALAALLAVPMEDEKNEANVALPAATLKGIRYIGSKGGAVEWELLADTMELRKELVVLNKVTLLRRLGGDRYTITGKEGSYDEKSGIVTINGDVLVTTSKGYSVKAQSAVYSMKEKSISSDAAVRLNSRRMDVSGAKFKMYLDEESFSLKEDVAALVREAGSGR